jgi:hypothetical protein
VRIIAIHTFRNKRAKWRSVCFEKIIEAQLVRNYLPLTELKISLPYIQQPLTDPCSETNESRPVPSVLLEVQFIIILTVTRRVFEWFFLSGFVRNVLQTISCMLQVPPISFLLDLIRSRDSVFSIVTVQSVVWIPIQEVNFSFLQKSPHRLWGSPSMLFYGYLGSFPDKVTGVWI